MGKKSSVTLIILSLFLLIHNDAVATQETRYLNSEKKAIILNDFAIRLFHEIGDTDRNVSFSPYSIALTLSLAGEGACGTTLAQIRNTIPESFKKGGLQNQLKPELNLFNALWMEKSYSFLDSYLNTIQKEYSTQLGKVDFKHQTRQSVHHINQWVENKTNRQIKNLIPHNAVDEFTRLIITNVIIFKSDWNRQFDPGQTTNAPFFPPKEEPVFVPMMNQQDEFRYFADEDHNFKMVELPYKNSNISMLVLLPAKKYGLFDLEKILDSRFLNRCLSRLEKQQIMLSLPKFSFSTSYALSKQLKKMGMTEAFTRRADFSKIDGTKNLYIKEIFHKAFVKVDEQGTEASAASSAVMGLGGVSQTPLFIADHPFLFFIIDRRSHTILFMGRVYNPL